MIFGTVTTPLAAKLALIESESNRTWTYANIEEEIEWFSKAFREQEKALIFLFCRSDAASITAYLAALNSGQAIAMLDGALAWPLKSGMVSRYRPDWIFHPAGAVSDAMLRKVTVRFVRVTFFSTIR